MVRRKRPKSNMSVADQQRHSWSEPATHQSPDVQRVPKQKFSRVAFVRVVVFYRYGSRPRAGAVMADQLGGQRGESIILTFGPKVLDRHIVALRKARLLWALAKLGHEWCESVERPGMEEADHRDHRLLCARRRRSGHPRASEPNDELARAAASYDAPSKLSQSRIASVSTESPGQTAWRSAFLGDWNPGAVLPAREVTPRPGARGE